MEVPKKLKRTVKKMAANGDDPVMIAPAILERYATERMIAMVRIGMGEDRRIFSWLITTRKNVHFVRPGLAWDKVQTVPLDSVDDIDYVREFHGNTLKLEIGGASEKIIFYEEGDGIKFYQYVKFKRWKD